MKAIISGLGAMGFLGWYLTGAGGGPDATREVAKPPQLVYSEISPLFPSGTRSIAGNSSDGRYHTIEIDVKKALDSAIDYKFKLDGEQVLTMSLDFAPADGGAATLLTGELELDQKVVRFAASQSGREAKNMPDFAVDWAMNEMVGKMADSLEAGQPLTKDMLFPLLNVTG